MSTSNIPKTLQLHQKSLDEEIAEQIQLFIFFLILGWSVTFSNIFKIFSLFKGCPSCCLVQCEDGGRFRQRGRGCCLSSGSSAGWGQHGRASSSNWLWGKDSFTSCQLCKNSVLWLEPPNVNDTTPLQMGDGNDEHHTIVPEPAVIFPSPICGRRHVRVPEIVHASRILKEERTRSYSKLNPTAKSLSIL